MGVGGQPQAPAALPPGKTRYPLYIRLGATWQVWTDAENLTPPGFDPRTVKHKASRYTDWDIPAKHPYFFTIQKVSKAVNGLPKASQLSVCIKTDEINTFSH